jgi:hypothetical protein
MSIQISFKKKRKKEILYQRIARTHGAPRGEFAANPESGR